MTLTRESGYTVWKAWRDGMLAQGRHVAPERMAWETLDERDHVLDAAIEAAVRAEQAAEMAELRRAIALTTAAFKEEVERLRDALEQHHIGPAFSAPCRLCAALAATPVAPVSDRCPAATHHRVRSYQSPALVGFDDDGPVYGDKTLVSDRCTVCGYDFTTALAPVAPAPAATEPVPAVESLDPHRVEQRTKADCIRASLSSITGLNVPDFTTPFLGDPDMRPFGDSQTWLRSRGWLLMDDTGERPMPGYSLAVGVSPTIANANHAAVALDGVVIWDPSPHRDDPGRVFVPSGYWPVRRIEPVAPAPNSPQTPAPAATVNLLSCCQGEHRRDETCLAPAATEPVGTMTDDEWAEWSDAIAPEPRP